MGFERTTLGKFIKVQGGYAYRSKDFISSGNNRVLKIKNIRFGSVDYDDTVFIRDELASATCQYKTKPKDVLISMTGSGPNAPNSLVGRVARIWDKEPEAWLNQRVGRLELIEENSISLDFIYYLLIEKKAQDFLVSNSSGSANQANISGKTIESLPCPNVSFSESKNISQILLSFDNKIQLNNQINQTLEDMAQAIFKSWFVDFDPVRAKCAVLDSGGSVDDAKRAAMQVISSKTEEQLNEMAKSQVEDFAELQRTAGLFPSKLVDSELGEIPEGWRISNIDKEVKIVGGGTPSTKELEYWENGQINWTTPRDLSGSNDKVLIETSRKITDLGLNKVSSGLLPIDTVLMSSRAPVGYLALTKVPLAINQGYIGMLCNSDLTSSYMLQWCNYNMPEIKSRSGGTTFKEISKSNFRQISCLVPNKYLINEYEKLASKNYVAITKNAFQNQTLIELRDTLLPKLLSGELNVSGLVESPK